MKKTSCANEYSFSPVASANRAEKSSVILITVFSALCIWVILVSLWRTLGEPIDAYYLSKAVIVFTLVPAVWLVHRTGLKPHEMGLSFKGCKRAVIHGLILSLAVIAFLPLLKIIMIKCGSTQFEGEEAFIVWNKYPFGEYAAYVFSVVIQDVASRCFLQTLLVYAIAAKHARLLAIVVSSLMFSALHLHLDFMYVVGSGCMAAVFGIIFDRDRSVWGLCIPHYVLGMLGGLLNLID